MRVCSKCKEEKDWSHFNKNGNNKINYYCKPCASARYKQWREDNLEHRRYMDKVAYYKSTYNLSDEEAHARAKDRTGNCKICGTLTDLVVDHCHTSGEVRGSICSACNSMLGYARDNTHTLRQAIAYLEEFYVQHL